MGSGWGSALSAAAVLVAGCALERGGLGATDTDAGTMAGEDAGRAVDAGHRDAGPGPRDGGGVEGGADAGPPDAGPVELGPFGTPRIIEELQAPGADDDPTLTWDELELYFNSYRGGRSNIWVSRRASRDDAWGTPEPVDELDTVHGETSPEVAPDGLTLWFASFRPGGPGGSDIYVSTRSRRDQPWGTPVLVAELCTGDDETSPNVAPSGTRIVLGRRIGDSYDLFEPTRSRRSDAWDAPVPVSFNTPDFDEGNGHLMRSERVLWLDWGDAGGGGQDIYVSERTSTGDPWARPVNVPELDSSSNDYDPWVSGDGRHIVFVSDRSGDLEIWEAFR